MKKRVIALLLVLLLILSSLPASVFAVSPWKNAAGWRQNEDGSVTHMSGTASISPAENIRNKNGFTLSFDLQIDSADDEMFSTVYRLSANNSEDYFYMRIKKSHGNWCAELQFYNGSWTTLTCKEGASGEWVSGLENTIHVTLAHRAGSKEFTIDIGTPYAGIVRGDVYTPAMDAFLAVRLLSLEVSTDNPQTDIFTLKNYTVTENTGSGSDIPVPEPTVFDVAKDLTVTGKTGDTLVLSLQNGGKALAAGDFMLCYDTSLLSLADATACNAANLLSMSGPSGRDIVSFAGLSGSSENDFAEIRFTLLQKLSNEPLRIIGKNLRSSALAVLSDPDAYRARLSLQPCVCEHAWTAVDEESVVPTCTEAGKTVYLCSKCDEKHEETIQALGHDYRVTLENFFGTIYTCARCEESYFKATPTCDGQADCPSREFTDLTAQWYHEAVDYVLTAGIMGSTSTTAKTFEPSTPMSRAMMVSMLYRLENSPEMTYTPAFIDVPKGKWYTSAVLWAAENSIVSGVGGGKFLPNGEITREQIATILNRYAVMKGYDVSARAELDSFSDNGSVSSWARDSLCWAYAAGIISGAASTAGVLLKPTGKAGRAEVASTLMRFEKLVVLGLEVQSKRQPAATPSVKGAVRTSEITYETAADNWTVPEGWSTGTDADGNLTLTGSSSELYYKYDSKLNFDAPLYFTYDISLADGATHTVWLKDIHNADGWGHYLLRFGNSGNVLGMTLQFADSEWHDASVTPDIWKPAMQHTTLRIRYETLSDTSGIVLTVSDATDGTVLYQGALTYHTAAYQADISWLNLTCDKNTTISHIACGTPAQAPEKPLPDPDESYETAADNWTVPEGWSTGTDADGNLTLTGSSSELYYKYDSKLNFDAPLYFTYDISLTDGATHTVWLKDIHNTDGWGHYLLRFGNSGNVLGMTLQFADSEWHDASVTPDIWKPTMQHTTLRIRYEKEKAVDGIVLTVSDAIDGTVLYKGALVYHVGTWQSDLCWFNLTISQNTIISHIATAIPTPDPYQPPTGEYEKNADNLGLGLGWTAGTDADGNLTLHCEANADGSVAQKPKADGSKPFAISYEVTFAENAYTSHAVFINGFIRNGYSGAYLVRFKNDCGTLAVEGQFSDGSWVNGVLNTISINPALEHQTLRITFEKKDGEAGLLLTVTDAVTGAVVYQGRLQYHEDNDWSCQQLYLTLWKDKGETELDIGKLLLKLPQPEEEAVALQSVRIKTPGSITAGTPTALYAEILPYDSKLVCTQWSITHNSVDTVAGSYRALYYTFEQAGSYTLTFTAEDTYGATYNDSIELTVLPASETSIQQLSGDVNGDGIINSTDALLVLLAGELDLRADEQLRMGTQSAAAILALAGGENGVQNQFTQSACDEFLLYMNDLAMLPISFSYGGKACRGFGADFTMMARDTASEGGKLSVTTTLLHQDNALQAEVQAAYYPTSNAYEWTVLFTNLSETNTPALSELNAADLCIAGENPVFKSISGDKEDEYAPIETDLTTVSTLVRRSVSGWASHDAFPYFNLENDNGGYVLALGWPGTWKAEFSYREGSTYYTAGQYVFDAALKPGETVRTPLMAFVKYDERNENVATNAWRRWYINYNMPRNTDGSLIEPVATVCANADAEYGLMNSFLSEQQAIDCISPMLTHGITPDYIWMDAGWYSYADGGSLPEWFYVGTNTVDASRLENGMATITAYGKENGMKSLLWFEPEFIRMPLDELCENFGFNEDWALYVEVDEHTRMNTYLCDLTNPNYQKWLIEHVSYVLDHAGIDCYRQDFNRSVGNTWSRQDAAGRIGTYENHYVQSYLQYWDTLKTLFPELTIDSCASGGGRNDLESMRRGVIFHRTDSFNADNERTQSMSWSLWKWLPYTNSNNSTAFSKSDNDTYALRTALAPVFKGMNDFRYFDRNDNWELAQQMLSEWESVKQYYYGDYYPLTDWNLNTSEWIGWEFNSPDTASAVLQLFRPADSEEASRTIVLYGLDAEKTYTVKDTDGINSITATGAELLQTGVLIRIPQARQALVLFVIEQA